jgi:DNA polymerase alpha subunit A
LVLEPKVGLYEDFVLLLDFNSLYPSIIQEHNICFTTVDRPDESQVPQCTTEAELLGRTSLPDGTSEEGVLPQVLKRLVSSRATVKAAIKSERDPKALQRLEIRQKALKLTANSMYGCLGFQNSRFYAKPLAAMITAKGREALQTTIAVVNQELQLDVVYGDTDSVFVNSKTSDFKAAMDVANQIKRSVNKRYKRLEIEIDGVFGRLMLLKKKKYAAVKVVDWENRKFETELKGLDIVRRDWCHLAKEMGERVLNQILGGEGKEEAVNWIHNYLTEKGQEMDERKLPVEAFVITKGLTKDPKDYPDAKNQPHVQVALRLQARGKVVRPGQEIGYVICEATGTEGPKANVSQRARHPHEFQLDPTLRVDIEWYKKQQVHPLISRTLAPIEGTDAARIAECLGMDGTRFALAAARAVEEGSAEAAEMAAVSGAVADVSALFDRQARWKDFQSTLPGIQCSRCNTISSWKQLLRPEAEQWESVNEMFRCSNKECREPINPKRAQNLLSNQVRQLLKDHSSGWVRCSEDTNIEKTRRLNRGQNMFGERAVLRELEYTNFLCEASYTGDDLRGCRQASAGMMQVSRWLLECNGYAWVNCGDIFSGMFGGGANAVTGKSY